jgi:hypothetical protein
MLLLALVLCVVDVGDGDGVALPIVGMSPANAETDRTHVRVNAIPSRFMEFLLFDNYQKSGIARYQISGIGK